MNRILMFTILSAALLTTTGHAQVEVTIGPKAVPLACDVLVSVSNNTASPFLIGSIGPIEVLSASGIAVFNFHALIFAPINVAPGEAIIHFRWNQLDNAGNQVPAGNYTMSVDINGSGSSQTLAIGGTDTALTTIGTLRPGTARRLYFCAPQHPGLIYGYAASVTSNTGFPTCGGVFPLDNDFLFSLSTSPGNGIFFNTVGLLAGAGDSTQGTTTDPFIVVPPNPALSGFNFEVAFLVVDVTSSCPVVAISAPETLTVF